MSSFQIITYFFASLQLGSALLLIGAQNPIHSILLLILVFAMGTFLLFALNLEVFGLIFLIVYVGAIVVLFLFIVMMLDIKVLNVNYRFSDMKNYKYLLVFFIFLEILFYLNEDFVFVNFFSDKENLQEVYLTHKYVNFELILDYKTHLWHLGRVLFSDFLFIQSFIVVGILLFAGMVGGIIVAIEENVKKTVKQQNVSEQILKNANNSIFILKK